MFFVTEVPATRKKLAVESLRSIYTASADDWQLYLSENWEWRLLVHGLSIHFAYLWQFYNYFIRIDYNSLQRLSSRVKWNIDREYPNL